jgi:hypothetical protein
MPLAVELRDAGGQLVDALRRDGTGVTRGAPLA